MLLPLRTDRPRIRPAYLTVTLIVVNTLVFLYGLLLPPLEVTGTLHGQEVQGEVSRLIWEHGLWGDHPTFQAFFTHMFIHAGLLHLAGNMLFLWIFGSLIEDTLRPWGLLALYLGGGVLAALAHIGISAAAGHDLALPMV